MAIIFLIATLPFCLWAAVSDLKRMKIPNRATDSLAVAFIIVGGYFALWGGVHDWQSSDYLWRFTHFATVLILGMLLTGFGGMGAGDAKFLAAAAPFVAIGDLGLILTLYLIVFITTFTLHRIVRATRLRSFAPGWKSWEENSRFPMGLAFGLTLPLYFLVSFLSVPQL